MKNKEFVVALGIFGVFAVCAPPAVAQKKQDGGARETVAKPMSEKERRKQEEKLKKELMTPYRKWLNEDVLYIITDEERKAFKNFQTDEEREQFIEQFWLRRDPSPDSQENEYKEEHYRRIAYANERFASGIPGWKTDRGRIYITFGPPDEIESHPSGGSYERPYEEGGGTTSTYPFEKWRYRYIEGVGQGTDINIEFVDTTMTGEYRMTMDPSEKDALLYVPGAGLTMMEQMGMSSKNDRFSRTDGTHLGTGTSALPARMGQFERLQQFADLQRAPKIKFKDLEAQVSSRIIFNVLPMQARADFFPATSSTIMTNVTLQFSRKDLQFKQEANLSRSVVNIYARITSLARRVVNVFEDVVSIEVPTEMLQEASAGSSIYQKSVPLPPGMYRLNVVAKDIIGGNSNNYEMALNVPAHGRRQALRQLSGARRPDREGPHQEHRHGPVRDWQLQGPAPRRRGVQAQREDGHLHEALQLPGRREDQQGLRPDRLRDCQEQRQFEGAGILRGPLVAGGLGVAIYG